MPKNTTRKNTKSAGLPEPESRPTSVADALDRAVDFARQGRLSVICGAGISIPGGLPGALQLVKAILDWTSLEDIEKGWVSKIVPARLPFERMMETILDTMADDARQDFIGLFRLGSPGPAHRFLGATCGKGLLKTVCTTNFDCHIETALQDSGLDLGKQFAVYHDLEDFRTIDWSDSRIRVLKLHGSVDNPDGLAVTVSKVADQTAAATLGVIMERIFGAGEDHAILALGYSFSDRFDLSPAIERIGSERRTSWILNVDHKEGLSAEGAELIGYRDIAPGPDASYSPNPLLKNPAAIQLKADTAWVVQELARRLEIELPQPEATKWEWPAYLQKFKESLDSTSAGMLPDSLAGALLTMIGAYKNAIPYLRRTVERAGKSGNDRVKLAVVQLLIEASLGAEDFIESWKLLTDTERLAKSIDDGKHADYVLGQLGDLYKQLAEKCLDRSRRYFEEALQVSIREEIGMRAVPHLAGIAAAWMHLGDMDAARLRYEQAYEISSQSADPTRAAGVCGNLASLEYIVQHYDKALEWYDKAIKLSHLAGDERTEGIHLMNKANVLVKQKRYPAAFRCYKSARKLLAGDALLSLLDYHETAAKRLRKESKN